MESMCGLHRPQRRLSKRQLPPTPYRSYCGCFGRAWYTIFSGRLLRIPADPHASPNSEKTSFINPYGLYCYNLMPFGLKNAGATYQRFVTKMFRPLLSSTMEVYMDDILVKSKQRSDHAAHLHQTFDRLREYGMKLNPLKCALKVSVSRFLGFIVTQRGIEANPAQLKAILQSPAPSSKKGI